MLERRAPCHPRRDCLTGLSVCVQYIYDTGCHEFLMTRSLVLVGPLVSNVELFFCQTHVYQLHTNEKKTASNVHMLTFPIGGTLTIYTFNTV